VLRIFPCFFARAQLILFCRHCAEETLDRCHSMLGIKSSEVEKGIAWAAFYTRLERALRRRRSRNAERAFCKIKFWLIKNLAHRRFLFSTHKSTRWRFSRPCLIPLFLSLSLVRNQSCGAFVYKDPKAPLLKCMRLFKIRFWTAQIDTNG